MTEKPTAETKLEFGRVETAALLLLILGVPLLLPPATRDYALFLLALAVLLAFLSLVYGLTRARPSAWRRAGVLGGAILVLYLARGVAAPEKQSLVDFLPAGLRQAFE
jgi:hypothetical protein